MNETIIKIKFLNLCTYAEQKIKKNNLHLNFLRKFMQLLIVIESRVKMEIKSKKETSIKNDQKLLNNNLVEFFFSIFKEEYLRHMNLENRNINLLNEILPL